MYVMADHAMTIYLQDKLWLHETMKRNHFLFQKTWFNYDIAVAPLLGSGTVFKRPL